jgi:hypothetical protein
MEQLRVIPSAQNVFAERVAGGGHVEARAKVVAPRGEARKRISARTPRKTRRGCGAPRQKSSSVGASGPKVRLSRTAEVKKNAPPFAKNKSAKGRPARIRFKDFTLRHPPARKMGAGQRLLPHSPPVPLLRLRDLRRVDDEL